ncbi:hypothetical protein QKU48_gp1046 [Fadolivirus algeromassiliense]|jgi:hypothetical protein|uniref:Uncharacterized protein n=1 Tax=Fadolivirus FV1/VV64 TaxID=3070911 RepID=A0A7D3QVP5_9VIRU|nr:hypothetical protein QKU48_gp1046 [Fadolivirus algeromassiliense]QKF94504.1 hypothetical protein Fadolivirus_1_1046 [Fadolivirus FV1/VV64]
MSSSLYITQSAVEYINNNNSPASWFILVSYAQDLAKQGNLEAHEFLEQLTKIKQQLELEKKYPWINNQCYRWMAKY